MTSTAPVAAEGRGGPLIETRSIDYVPDDERHGRVSHQGPFWFVGNFQPFTLALGFVGPSLGLSLGWTIVAGLAGVLFCTPLFAVFPPPGPPRGVPPVIYSPGPLGVPRGLLP